MPFFEIMQAAYFVGFDDIYRRAPRRTFLTLGFCIEGHNHERIFKAMKTNFKCPVCRKSLTKQEYERALGILGEREKHLTHEKSELQRKLREIREQARKAKAEGVKTERSRTQRLLAGRDKEIQKLKERLNQLKKGTTPQTEGLEFEETLTIRLRREFPDDKIEHKGKGGDILHFVNFAGKPAGLIVYECKRTPRIDTKHIHQANQAKKTREADFAVLVTTGKRSGFSGLAQMSGVLVISPLGVVPLASLLRAHLIEMIKAKITKDKRAIIAQSLMRYITSPQFKNPIEEVIEVAAELQEMLKEEAKDHFRLWRKRWDRYQTIHWDNAQIQSNLERVLHGKEPKTLLPVKTTRLELPASIDQK